VGGLGRRSNARRAAHGSLARVRSNPFFAVITGRIDEAVRADAR
jgi:hypothetical protein